jgi:hypothetical protein
VLQGLVILATLTFDPATDQETVEVLDGDADASPFAVAAQAQMSQEDDSDSEDEPSWSSGKRVD